MRMLTACMVLSALASFPSSVLAGPNCTNEAQSNWIAEDAMKTKIAEMGYKDIKIFKVTKGNCYEIYGYTKDNVKAEVYFHPVTGEVVDSKIGG